MWREIVPDERIEVKVGDYKVIAFSFGKGPETVFCLNGGPGLPCDYLRDSHSCLIDHGYRVVAFDQLGTGSSDRPTDASLWTITRYVAETDTLEKHKNAWGESVTVLYQPCLQAINTCLWQSAS